MAALRSFGFDSWKLDGCGAQLDMQLWDDLIRASKPTSGRAAIMVENCHWGSRVPFEPNASWCPWNFYRTSGDVRAKYASVVGNLHSTVKYAREGLVCAAPASMHHERPSLQQIISQILPPSF